MRLFGVVTSECAKSRLSTILRHELMPAASTRYEACRRILSTLRQADHETMLPAVSEYDVRLNAPQLPGQKRVCCSAAIFNVVHELAAKAQH